uniref:Calmodulin binding protein-like N-terminal domain-containing protein n=1 Tax=Cucumis sativus TaxID=3659 RepID=A0A0A0LYY5_CUCSA
MEDTIFRRVSKEFDRKLLSSYTDQFLLSLSSSAIQRNNHNNEETTKFSLCFLNQIPSTIFTNNEIETGNADALQVALIDVKNSNAILSNGLLSIAQIELLGKNVSNKSWNAMVTNAMECVPLVKSFAPSFKRQDLLEYEGMGSEGFEENLEVSEQRNSSDWNKILETTFEEWEPMQEASTSYKYNP